MIRETKVLSARFGQPQSWTLDSAVADGVYDTWRTVLKAKRPPAELVAEVKASGLKGRGRLAGGYQPFWARVSPSRPARPKAAPDRASSPLPS